MRIAIIGLGLIGGSWAMALRRWSRTEEGRTAKIEVVGFDSKGKRRTEADKMNLCDRYTATPMDAVKEAEVVIVAVPPIAVRETFEDIAEHLMNGAIVTDTSSTKRDIMQWAKELLPMTVSFIGGHPMAGKTASLEGATADLFQRCTYCLIPAPNVREEAIEAMTRLVEITGARPHFIDPDEHDSYVAAVSHLPFILSAALTNLTSESAGWREISKLTAGAYQDMTRLSGGSVLMHLDIARTNADAIIGWLDRYQQALSEVRFMLERAGLRDERGRSRPLEETDPTPLQNYLEHALEARERWEMEKAKQPDDIGQVVEMPTKRELQSEYTRMLTGGLFKKRGENGNRDQPGNKKK